MIEKQERVHFSCASRLGDLMPEIGQRNAGAELCD
jgi:hypothetical protein